MAPSPPATVDELGIRGCLYLWALLTGQDNRLPIAQTKRMTLVAMGYLQERGIIEVPWPEARWQLKPDARITPIEGLQWWLSWEVYESHLLIDALDDYFGALKRDDFTTAERLRLWTELGSAEAERFFEQQLVKHRFSSDWAQDIAFAYRDSSVVLTVAQWRYCAWAAVRRGASMALQEGQEAAGLRDAIYQEIRRRAASLASGTWTGGSFVPFSHQPESALGRGFVQRVTQLGALYWTSLPSIEMLVGHGMEHTQRLGMP